MKKNNYWIWLHRTPGIGTKKFLSLYKHFGELENVYNAQEKDFFNIPRITKRDINSILNNKNMKGTLEYIEKMRKQNIDILLLKDNTYPSLLKEIYDPPPVLYRKGNMEINEIAISIVGSRNASYYGLKMAEELAFKLASLGITIVSGMARGIDTYAHKGALQAKGKTIAVLGCGVDVIYPVENIDLMKEIEEKGLIVSEYPLATLPKANNFPARNRIISGLSLGTVIIEAAERSGSLITAEFALEQGRNVYAIPGNINNKTSKGTNNLIKEGAKIVTNVEDIIEDIFPYLKSEISTLEKEEDNEVEYGDISNEERIIIERIEKGYNDIDKIIESSNLTTSIVNSCLIMLELKGIIEKHVNEYYIK